MLHAETVLTCAAKLTSRYAIYRLVIIGRQAWATQSRTSCCATAGECTSQTSSLTACLLAPPPLPPHGLSRCVAICFNLAAHTSLLTCRGPWWGAEGYVRVQMTADNVGTCQMYSAGLMLPLGTQAVGSAPPPPLPSPSPSPSPVPSSSPSPSPSPFPSPKPCKTKRCE